MKWIVLLENYIKLYRSIFELRHCCNINILPYIFVTNITQIFFFSNFWEASEDYTGWLVFPRPSSRSFAILDTRVTTTEFRISVSARSRRERRSYRENLRGALSISPGNTYLSLLLRNKRLRDSKLSGGVERVGKGWPMYQRMISIVWSLKRW